MTDDPTIKVAVASATPRYSIVIAGTRCDLETTSNEIFYEWLGGLAERHGVLPLLPATFKCCGDRWHMISRLIDLCVRHSQSSALIMQEIYLEPGR